MARSDTTRHENGTIHDHQTRHYTSSLIISLPSSLLFNRIPGRSHISISIPPRNQIIQTRKSNESKHASIGTFILSFYIFLSSLSLSLSPSLSRKILPIFFYMMMQQQRLSSMSDSSSSIPLPIGPAGVGLLTYPIARDTSPLSDCCCCCWY